MEQVDLYGVVDGKETVIMHGCVCYVGRDDNPSFGQCRLLEVEVPEVLLIKHSGTVGSEPLDDLARIIWSSVGPSGPNKDYMLNLASAVRELAPESHDSHLAALEVRLLVARFILQLKFDHRTAYMHLTKLPSHDLSRYNHVATRSIV